MAQIDVRHAKKAETESVAVTIGPDEVTRDRASELPASPLAVLCIDCDGLKSLVEELGPDLEHPLMGEIAARLASHTRPTDSLARVDSDRFALIVNELDGPEAAATLAGTIVQSFADRLCVAGRKVCVSVSVGVAVFPDHGVGAQALLAAAESTARAIRQQGGNDYRLG